MCTRQRREHIQTLLHFSCRDFGQQLRFVPFRYFQQSEKHMAKRLILHHTVVITLSSAYIVLFYIVIVLLVVIDVLFTIIDRW